MKNVDPRISAHVRSEVTTLCTCWKLVRRDQVEYFWTDHDGDVFFEGDLYVSAAGGGFDRTAIESSLSLDITNAELVGFLGEDLDRAELSAGLFDFVEITMSLVNWADPNIGSIIVRHGTLGEVVLVNENLFRVEMRGLQQAYKQVIGEVYSPECRANFGDKRCGIDLANYTAQFTVASVQSRSIFSVTDDGTPGSRPDNKILAPPGMLNFGIVKFLTGENAGTTLEVKQVVGHEIRLKFAMPNIITAGDTFELIAGCDQRLDTCKLYDNVLNFRGEPFLPGNAAVFKIQGR